jgi:DNA-binding NarL/FixJ family response regulator
MAEVVVFLDNLFFQARLLDAAKRAGVSFKMVSTVEQFLAAAREHPGALLVVDLDARARPIEAIEQLRATGGGQAVIAFLSHVEVDLAERARAAGCRQVLSRFEFTQSLPAILAEGRSAGSPESKTAGGPEPSGEPRPASRSDS